MQSRPIFYDFHCHDSRFEQGVVKLVSLPEAEFHTAPEQPGVFYSLQLHPWHNPEVTPSYSALARADKALALGEIGLDKRCSTPFAVQEKAFDGVLDLAEELQKPVVIHCVGAWSELFAAVAHRHLPCKLLHGFHGSPELLLQLFRHGFVVSFSPNAWQKPALRNLLSHDETIRALCVPERDLLPFQAGEERKQRKGGLLGDMGNDFHGESGEMAEAATASAVLDECREKKESDEESLTNDGRKIPLNSTGRTGNDGFLTGCGWSPESAASVLSCAKPFTAGGGLALLLSLLQRDKSRR